MDTGSSASAAAPAAGSPQPATTVGANDAINDVVPVNDCHADITAFAGDYTDTSIGVDHGVVCGSDPNTDAHWTVGLTGILWAIDVNGSNQVDYEVFYLNFNGLKATVNLPDKNLTKVCDADPRWNGKDIFAAFFPASCIGSPVSFRMQAFMLWDDTPATAKRHHVHRAPRDWAPNGTAFEYRHHTPRRRRVPPHATEPTRARRLLMPGSPLTV